MGGHAYVAAGEGGRRPRSASRGAGMGVLEHADLEGRAVGIVQTRAADGREGPLAVTACQGELEHDPELARPEIDDDEVGAALD